MWAAGRLQPVSPSTPARGIHAGTQSGQHRRANPTRCRVPRHRGARQFPAPLLLPLPWPRLGPQAWLLLPPSSALRPNPASSSASPRGGQSLLGAGSAWMEPVRRDIAGCDPRAQRGGHTRRPGATSQDRGLRASGRTRVPAPRPRGAAAAGAAAPPHLCWLLHPRSARNGLTRPEAPQAYRGRQASPPPAPRPALPRALCFSLTSRRGTADCRRHLPPSRWGRGPQPPTRRPRESVPARAARG